MDISFRCTNYVPGLVITDPHGAIPMDISFRCTNCGQSIVIDEAQAGTIIVCPKCAARLTAPRKLGTKHISFACGNCGQDLAVDESRGGMSGPCPSCGVTVRIPPKPVWSPGINDRAYKTSSTGQRRQEREAQRRQRELERRAKEQAKLSAIEQARLEVETYENRLEVLLSVHRQQGEIWDWHAIVAALAPVCPQRLSNHEFRARQQSAILAVADLHPSQEEDRDATVEQARLRDEEEFQTALQTYTEEKVEWEKMKSLARGILAGEHKAYIEALVDLNPFGEIADLGSSIQFTVHNARLLGCVLKVNGQQAIPSDVKSLTATGKVSVKTMPKARFHEIYQDYVCGCVLRVAREVFALLPVEALLVTASADTLDPRTGQIVEQPVLSAAILRTVAARLDFDRLDPSEAIENFLHRGDFKASRKSGAFESVAALTPADLPQGSFGGTDFRDIVANVRRLRDELRSEIERLTPQPNAPELSVKESV